MSQRKKTAPPTPKHPRSSSAGRKGLIAKETTKKQSAKRRTALDNRFHRTVFSVPSGFQKESASLLNGFAGRDEFRPSSMTISKVTRFFDCLVVRMGAEG